MNPLTNDYSVKNYESQEYSRQPDLASLFTLSKRNVEGRIRGLEADIKTRQKLSDQALSALSTHKTRLREQVRPFHYLGASGEHRDFSKQVAKLEEAVIREMTSCFGDVSKLREKLQEAKEELETEKQKLKLAISETYRSVSTPEMPTPRTPYEFAPQHVSHYAPKYSVFN